MSAVVAVLNESLTESIRGFYKLRKAYITLDGILNAEQGYMSTKESQQELKRLSKDSLDLSQSINLAKAPPGGVDNNIRKTSADSSRSKQPSVSRPENAASTGSPAEDDDDDEFYDVDEDKGDNEKPPIYAGHVDIDGVSEPLKDLKVGEKEAVEANEEVRSLSSSQTSLKRPQHSKSLMLLDHDPSSEIFANPVDAFVHSGANLCFGLLLLMISLIPPAFGKLLFIIGFRGDRERGIRMLWQASKFHNINGGMAGLIVLGYYNGLIGFCDILPDSSGEEDDVEGYPVGRLQDLLLEMRSRYPKSQLWILEEARMAAANRRLDEAIKLLSGEKKSPLKQVEALDTFEKSLNSMYIHDYALCSESFLKVSSISFPSIPKKC